MRNKRNCVLSNRRGKNAVRTRWLERQQIRSRRDRYDDMDNRFMFMRDKRIDDCGSEREARQPACGPKAVVSRFAVK